MRGMWETRQPEGVFRTGVLGSYQIAYNLLSTCN